MSYRKLLLEKCLKILTYIHKQKEFKWNYPRMRRQQPSFLDTIKKQNVSYNLPFFELLISRVP